MMTLIIITQSVCAKKCPQNLEFSDDFGLVSQKSITTLKTLKRFPVTTNIS